MARGCRGIGGPPAFANRLDESRLRESGESVVSSPMTHRLGMFLHSSGRIKPVESGWRGMIGYFRSSPEPR
jgi:hypothetical protein